jgi:hypothetical protein
LKSYWPTILSNPNCPFDKITNVDDLLEHVKIRKYDWLLRNRNLPMELVREYSCKQCKNTMSMNNRQMPPNINMIYIYNNNIRQILQEYPPIAENQHNMLLKNPAYYTYCVEEEVIKCLMSS